MLQYTKQDVTQAKYGRELMTRLKYIVAGYYRYTWCSFALLGRYKASCP